MYGDHTDGILGETGEVFLSYGCRGLGLLGLLGFNYCTSCGGSPFTSSGLSSMFLSLQIQTICIYTSAVFIGGHWWYWGAVKHAPHSFLDYLSKLCSIQDDKMSCLEHMGPDIQFVTPHISSCPFRLSVEHNEERHFSNTSVVHLMSCISSIQY